MPTSVPGDTFSGMDIATDFKPISGRLSLISESSIITLASELRPCLSLAFMHISYTVSSSKSVGPITFISPVLGFSANTFLPASEI